MAKILMPFGGQTIGVTIPDGNLAEVLTPKATETLPDLDAAIERALDNPINQPPLEEIVKPSDRVVLISDDNTRLTPVHRMIPPLLSRLNRAGVPDENISCIMALGTHRYMTDEEMKARVGPSVYKKIKVFNHAWRNPDALVDMGFSSRGTPLQVNRAIVEADVVIGLGTIVPHHIPGFSGSSKIIQPGVSGAKTTAETHMLSCECGGDSFLGIEDNPVRRDMDDMADKVGMKTIFNVVMDSTGGVAGIFYGEMRAAFREGVELARRIYGMPYHETPAVVLANAFPCEIDFWQSHKAQYPAVRMLKPGGTLIICTPAPEGISPVHKELLDFTAWPSEKIKTAYRQKEIKNGVAAALAIAWAMVREKVSVITYSPGIPAEDKKRLGHTHAPTIEWAVAEALRRQGADARMTVLTHAPEMLPVDAVDK
jgi:nickel-dependent lactate racemase